MYKNPITAGSGSYHSRNIFDWFKSFWGIFIIKAHKHDNSRNNYHKYGQANSYNILIREKSCCGIYQKQHLVDTNRKCHNQCTN